MRKLLVVLLMVIMATSSTFAAGPYDGYQLDDQRPDGEYGYQWYEESWSQMELKKIIVDKKGTCTGITLYDRLKGLTLTFDFKITKDRLSKYKLQGNKFFYNYQTDWFQVETKGGDIIYTDAPVDPLNGELYNIKITN